MRTTPTISIYFADTGGGHRSAANAVKAGIDITMKNKAAGRPAARIFCQPIIEKSHPVYYYLVKLYNHMARHHISWIKYLYLLIHFLKPESCIYSGLYRTYLRDLIRTQNPSLIVSVHPMLADGLTQTIRELDLTESVKCAVVVTDPNEKLWRAWGCKQADLIIAPNKIVHDCLLSWGIDESKIKVLGMPVHPQFVAPPQLTRDEFLTRLGLNPDLLTVCINAGWAGNSHLLKIYEALSKYRRKIQVIFLTGYNETLEHHVREAAQISQIATRVLSFSDHMSELMSWVDVMITKAGGLTVYEALARRLPIIFDNTIEAMPQEASTMDLLVNLGVAEKLNRPYDIVSVIDRLTIFQNRHKALPSQYQLDLTDHAIFDIASNLLGLIDENIYKIDPETKPSKKNAA